MPGDSHQGLEAGLRGTAAASRLRRRQPQATKETAMRENRASGVNLRRKGRVDGGAQNHISLMDNESVEVAPTVLGTGKGVDTQKVRSLECAPR